MLALLHQGIFLILGIFNKRKRNAVFFGSADDFVCVAAFIKRGEVGVRVRAYGVNFR